MDRSNCNFLIPHFNVYNQLKLIIQRVFRHFKINVQYMPLARYQSGVAKQDSLVPIAFPTGMSFLYRGSEAQSREPAKIPLQLVHLFFSKSKRRNERFPIVVFSGHVVFPQVWAFGTKHCSVLQGNVPNHPGIFLCPSFSVLLSPVPISYLPPWGEPCINLGKNWFISIERS